MGLDIISALLIWIAIKLQDLKTDDKVSSLSNFGWLFLQCILVGTALIITKMNPYIW